MESAAKSVDEVLEEIMRIHRSLPPRPGIDDVEGAKILIRNLEVEEQAKFDAIVRQTKRKDVTEELFTILVEMQKNLVRFKSEEQKKEAIKLLDLENYHQVFDEMIQRASNCCDNSTQSVASTSSNSFSSFSTSNFSNASPHTVTLPTKPISIKTSELLTRDDSYVTKSKPIFNGDVIRTGLQSNDVFRPQIVDSTLKPATTSGQNGAKLNLMKLASLIEVSSKKGTKDLNLCNKLTDQIEWLPDSIGKISTLITLNLSENRLVSLPSSISSLSSLTKLDLHSNKLIQLPESLGDLLNLIHLDLRANQLTSLPVTLTKLIHLQELDLSSNNLSILPESIGSLINLQKLNIETNDIEEIPHVIGQCVSLKELLADYNKLKALPEAVGKLESLEILSVRYNNIGRLPTTISSLINLKELNVSFNELESVPESLCFATTLMKINISNNFADLRSLPRSIGNLENLEELDMSKKPHLIQDADNLFLQLQQIKVTPLGNSSLYNIKESREIDFALERGLCSLLVGEVDECRSWLGLNNENSHYRDPSIATFVMENSQDDPENDLLPGLCKLLETWLMEVVFPRFRETTDVQFRLVDYYDDPVVLRYLERLAGVGGSPLAAAAAIAKIGAGATAVLDSVKIGAIKALQKVFPAGETESVRRNDTGEFDDSFVVESELDRRQDGGFPADVITVDEIKEEEMITFRIKDAAVKIMCGGVVVGLLTLAGLKLMPSKRGSSSTNKEVGSAMASDVINVGAF